MGIKGYFTRFGLVGAICIASSFLTGMSETTIRINLSAHVPLVCRVGFDISGGSYDESGRVQLGSTRELCNSAQGYKLYASTSGTDEGAKLIVGNRSFPIRNGVEIMVADSVSATEISRDIFLDAGDGHGGGNVSIRIEAK